ncbi:hypothetical protein PG993_003141 [Apiospora rasikravindrae]|uniref:Cytochrome P450 n=1 Tax=Apiospora rasikravindrae TaxID=990691 RepID=A0ABR1U0V4_9PEZI
MWAIAILLVSLVFFSVCHECTNLFGSLYHHSIYKVHVARDVVSFKRFNVRTLGERLLIRALPNQRLIAAFGINNAFTTTDPWVHKRFVRYATGLINRVNADNEEWQHLSLLGRDTLRRHLSADSGREVGDQQQQRLHLTSTVRILCFVVVLHFLFPGVENIDLQATRSVTEDINRLWVQSKHASRPVSKREQDCLVTKIRQMLPINGKLYDLSGLGEQSNPLNTILPAFETLWRVVLLTYVHIAFRGTSSDGPRVTTESLVGDMLADLPSHLGTGNDKESAALMISKEALRLYPPTKRIHRAASPFYHHAQTSCPKVVAADIESLHRDTFIWGHNAHDFFLPRMGQGLTQTQKDAYMPFGLAPHLCPASNKFGERMIAMLLGVLFSGLGSKGTGTTIEYGDAELDGDLFAHLPTGREDAEGWSVTL